MRWHKTWDGRGSPLPVGAHREQSVPAAAWCRRSCRPWPAMRSSASGTRVGRRNPATRRRLWEIRGATFPEILGFPPTLPGCASTRDPEFRPDGRERSPGQVSSSCWGKRRLAANCGFANPFSSVTRGTTGNVGHGAQPIFGHQVASQRDLIGVSLAIDHDRFCAGRLFIAHIEYLIARPQIFFRRAMAVQTPLHLQRSVVIHQRHAVNGAVAGIAAHALIDMNAVIEINEIGEVVDPVPDKRFAAAETFTDRFEHGGACPNLRMTIHAGSGGRNAGKARNFHGSMAI